MQKISTEEDIKQIILNDPWMMRILECAAELDLPDWMIGAGFIRNKIWDYLHGYPRTISDGIDIDLIYFDPDNIRKETEKSYEEKLRNMMDENWSVKNQARMSDKYESSEDAISYWPETCTCIAVKIVPEKGIKIIAPAGVEDLTSLVVRRGAKFADEAEYRNRIKRKEWEKKWPGLKII